MAITKWVATVSDNQWLVAKVRVRGLNVKILKLQFLLLKGTSEEETDSPESSLLLETRNLEESEDSAREKIVDAGKKLNSILRRKGISAGKLSLSISCSGVVTRIVTVPVMKKKLLEALFAEQLQQYFTLNVADYIIDYRVLKEVVEEGQKRYKVLLAALPREFWNRQWQVLQEAKVQPKAVDIQFECLLRLYGRLNKQIEAKLKKTKGEKSQESGKSANPVGNSADIAILDLSGDRAEIILLEQGVFFLFSDVKINSHAMYRLSIAQRQIRSKAEVLSRNSDDDSYKEAQFLENSDPMYDPADLENLLLPVMRNLSEYLSFFSARHFGKNVDLIYITGEYASLQGIEELFRANLEIETRIGYPEGWMPRFSRKAARLKVDPSRLGSLIGLALREE